MNDFKFEELFVEQTVEFSRDVTTDVLEKFQNISGDNNPLHTDEDFAKSKGF